MSDDPRTMTWRHAGIGRDEAGIREGRERLAAIRERAADLTVTTRTDESFAAALRREESRGAHYRTNDPERTAEWRRTQPIERDAVGGPRITDRAVDDPGPAIREALDRNDELIYRQPE